MTTRLIAFIRGNAVALCALFVALGGTSYAATQLPRGSVGTNQLRNDAVTPSKLGSGIGGSVRAWAVVSANGKLLASGGAKHVSAGTAPSGPDGQYQIDWGTILSKKRCATVASIDRSSSSPTETVPDGTSGPLQVVAGYASGIETATTRYFGKNVSLTGLFTLNQGGQLAPLTFDVAVIC